MRMISIRNFQRNFYQEIKNIPLIITKRGVPIFSVTANTNVTTQKQYVTTQPKIKSEEKPSSLKKCPHGVLIGIGFCNKGCKM